MTTPEQHFAAFRARADAHALAAVFDALAPQLLLIAAHVAPPGAEAEDLVQATFLDAIERAARWDANRPLLPWLIGILVNHARYERRRLGRNLDADHAGAPRNEPSPLDALAAAEAAEAMARALRGLPRQYRHALTLRLVHGLTPTAIAHAVGCPVATVKTRLQRGMEMLRQVLPVGIAGAFAGMVTTGRGLAAVREAVLAKAPTLVPASAVAVGIVCGGLLMKKTLAMVAVVGCATALWFVLPVLAVPGGEGIEAPVPRPTSLAVAPMPSVEAGAGADENAPVASAARRAVVAAPTGSAELEFVWKDDGSPAAHLRVSGQPWSSGGEGRSIQARADANGHLALVDLPPGRFYLLGAELQAFLEVRAGETLRQRIEVEPSLRIEGLVVDAGGNGGAGGHGVAGAKVWMQYFPDPAETAPRLVATTDPTGAFVCRLDRTMGSLWAQRQGFVAPRYEDISAKGTTTVRLALVANGAAARGRVRTSDGAPASGARVIVLRAVPSEQQAPPVELTCDGEGSFTTTELAAGEHVLVAQAIDHAATPLRFTVGADVQQILEVQLQRGATVAGTVRAREGVLQHARAQARPTWCNDLRPLYNSCTVRTTATADGSYRLTHVPPGAVLLEVDANDLVGAKCDLDLHDGEEARRDFVLGGGVISGRLIDGRNAGVPAWEVQASPVGGGRGGSGTTDEHGRFVIRGLDAAEYSVDGYPVEVRHVGALRAHWTQVARVRLGAEVVLQARHQVADGGHVAWQFLDAAGAPVHHTHAILTRVGEVQGAFLDVEGRDGRFEIGPMAPGRYAMVVRIPGQGAMSLGTVDVPAGGQLDLGTRRLPASGTLDVRLRLPDGRSLEPLDLTMMDSAWNGGEVFAPSAGGMRRSKPLPAGRYRLRAWGEAFAPLLQDVDIVAGAATEVNLTVSAATPVRFELSLPPVPSPPAREAPAQRFTLAIKDASGAFVAFAVRLECAAGETAVCTRGLLPGTYAYEAQHHVPHAESVRATFVVPRDTATTQRVVFVMPTGQR